MEKGVENLQPLSKVAKEFGVDRQTISNWLDDGLLKGTVINRNKFVTRSSIEELKGKYPECTLDDSKINEYKMKINDLESELRLLRKERIYRNYAPRYMEEFIKKFMDFIEKLDMKDEIRNRHIHESIFHYWLFNSDVDNVHEIITSYERGLSAQVYSKIFDRMTNYKELLLENRRLNDQVNEMTKEITRLTDDVRHYSEIHESVKAIEDKKSKGEVKSYLNCKIEEMDLSYRTINLLKFHGIETINQLVRFNKTDLLKLYHIGKKSLNELDDLLESMNLSFGMFKIEDHI